MRKLGLSLERGALLFALLVSLIACVLPLTGTFGPESALLLSLLLAPWAAALGAHAALHGQGKSSAVVLFEAAAAATRLLALCTLVIALNGLRTNPCEPSSGLRFFVLGPWASLLLASVAGVAVGSAIARKSAALALAAALPLLEVARAALRLWSSPAIFAYGHFFGYFPGTFYDRRVELPEAWLSHRLLSALLALGIWALISALRDPETSRLSRARLPAQLRLLALACTVALAAAVLARKGHALHHAASSGAITEQLGLVVETPRCRAVLPRETLRGDAHRLAEDCELRITQLERLLGVQERGPVTAFFFRSAQEKKVAMGAGRVYIAKPWRREVYLQLAEYPHPVLAHELAHVVARQVASGPFGVPGRLFGLVPEPTLVEGMAVALEPHARDELTAHQWAKAAYASGSAPPLSSLLGVGFFANNQALSYVLAGSFLRFVLETRGADALRRVYTLGSVERALGAPLATLEAEWRTKLETVPLPERAAALARQRFERPGVFSQVCPHLVERLESELGAALSAGDLERATDKCRDVLRVDPQASEVRATLTALHGRRGQERDALAELERLRGPPSAPTPTIARARVALADAYFERGELERAAAEYRALLEQPQPENDLRQLDVKLLALASPEPEKSLLRELLVGDGFRNSDPRTAMHLIRDLGAVRRDGLALYLEARQLSGANRYDLVQPLLRAALSRGLPTERVRIEALRMQVHAAFVMGSLAEAEAIAVEFARREGASLAEQLEAKDWQSRIAFRRSRAK